MDFIKIEKLCVSKDIINKETLETKLGLRATHDAHRLRGAACALRCAAYMGARGCSRPYEGADFFLRFSLLSTAVRSAEQSENRTSQHTFDSQLLQKQTLLLAGNVVLAYVLFLNLMRNEQPPTSLHPLSALSLGTLIFNSVS